MGSVLLGIVARRRSEKKSLNSSLEIGECVLDSKEVLLLETPPLGTRHQQSLKPEPVKQSANIGKLARIPNRKVRDEQKVTVKVSHDNFLIAVKHFRSVKLWNRPAGCELRIQEAKKTRIAPL